MDTEFEIDNLLDVLKNDNENYKKLKKLQDEEQEELLNIDSIVNDDTESRFDVTTRIFHCANSLSYFCHSEWTGSVEICRENELDFVLVHLATSRKFSSSGTWLLHVCIATESSQYVLNIPKLSLSSENPANIVVPVNRLENIVKTEVKVFFTRSQTWPVLFTGCAEIDLSHYFISPELKRQGFSDKIQSILGSYHPDVKLSHSQEYLNYKIAFSTQDSFKKSFLENCYQRISVKKLLAIVENPESNVKLKVDRDNDDNLSFDGAEKVLSTNGSAESLHAVKKIAAKNISNKILNVDGGILQAIEFLQQEIQSLPDKRRISQEDIRHLYETYCSISAKLPV